MRNDPYCAKKGDQILCFYTKSMFWLNNEKSHNLHAKIKKDSFERQSKESVNFDLMDIDDIIACYNDIFYYNNVVQNNIFWICLVF